MKLAGAAAAGFLARPPGGHPGVLLFGTEPMRIALKRQDLAAALVGPAGDAEMRLTRLSAAQVREDGSVVRDALKAQGFFPGPRAVTVEDATDGLAPAIAAALDDWREGDATLVVAAGNLSKTSALRKLYEGHARAAAIGIYDDPPGRDEIAAILKGAGLAVTARDAAEAIEALARTLDPGEFRLTVEKIALYKLGDPAPLSPDDIAVCAPAVVGADIDAVLDAVAGHDLPALGRQLRRLQAQGTEPVAVCIQAVRHFRTLHQVASDPQGPEAGAGRLRPPAFGPRRDRLVRQARLWGVARLELALRILTDTDLALRSSARAPAMAVMERALIRLAVRPR